MSEDDEKKLTKTESGFKLTGSRLLVEKPFAYALKSSLLSEICDNCFQRKQVKKCSGCQTLFYCSRECQKQGWKIHRKECPLLFKIKPQILPDAAFFLSRIIFSLERNPDEKSYYTEKDYRKFDDLQSHEEEIRKDKSRMEHIALLSAVLHRYLGQKNVPRFEELVKLYGKMCINSFSILDPDMQCIGSGIYLGGSILDHSCKPNAVTVFKGTTLYVISTEDINHFEWSKVQISYEDLLSLTSKRQAELSKYYYFDCKCPRCLDFDLQNLETSMLCQSTNCGGPVYMNNSDASEFACKDCNQPIRNDKVKKYKKFVLAIEEKLANKSSVIVNSDVDKWCQKIATLAHPLNYYYVKLLDLACEEAIKTENWKGAAEYGSQLVSGFRHYYGALNPILGIHLMKLSNLYISLNNKKMAVKHFQEAIKILKLTNNESILTYHLQGLDD